MREVLELCIELDRIAHSTYSELAERCPDGELASLFSEMAAEEASHIEWWSELLAAWAAGLVPDIVDGSATWQRLEEVRESIVVPDVSDCDTWSTDDMLDLAVSFEFYMLDPLFGELLNLLQPGSTTAAEAYDMHVGRLIEAVETHYTRPGVGRLLAGVLKRAIRDQQRLVSLAAHDQLTGLFNRRGVLTHLTHWLAWSQRYRRSLGLLLVDIDHFKQINDRFGHQRGDDALRQTAQVLLDSTRGSDIVGRVGGDEFLLIVPETDIGDLKMLMDRIVESVRDSTIEGDSAPLRLAASVGGGWSDGSRAVDSAQLIALADRSLYAAKDAGRARAGDVLLPESL